LVSGGVLVGLQDFPDGSTPEWLSGLFVPQLYNFAWVSFITNWLISGVEKLRRGSGIAEKKEVRALLPLVIG
jgi:hypothetical protein